MSSLWKIGPSIFGATLSAGLLLAAPVLATENAIEEASVEENDDDRICRRIHVTGSRIPQRICMKRSDWVLRRAQNEEEAERMLEGSDENYDLVTEQDLAPSGPATDGSRGY